MPLAGAIQVANEAQALSLPLYGRIAKAFGAAAERLGTPLVWGGDWPSLRDGPHFELDRRAFP